MEYMYGIYDVCGLVCSRQPGDDFGFVTLAGKMSGLMEYNGLELKKLPETPCTIAHLNMFKSC